jgi:hypothetical protein
MGMYLRDSARAFELWLSGAGPTPLEVQICAGALIGLFLCWVCFDERL